MLRGHAAPPARLCVGSSPQTQQAAPPIRPVAWAPPVLVNVVVLAVVQVSVAGLRWPISRWTTR
jgi:hypothetical protein